MQSVHNFLSNFAKKTDKHYQKHNLIVGDNCLQLAFISFPLLQIFMDNKEMFLLHQLLPNIEWVITNTSAVRNEVTYECCPEKYVDLTFCLVITRQWGFFFKFMLLPAALLSCLTLVIFWIPPMRPDRTGLGKLITVASMRKL